jgi:hypothetical protein
LPEEVQQEVQQGGLRQKTQRALKKTESDASFYGLDDSLFELPEISAANAAAATDGVGALQADTSVGVL